MFYINHKHITNYFQQLKNLYGNFWKCHDGKKEYYLKLDGYYFCDKTNATFVVIRIRNKRISETYPILEIVNDKIYLKEIHPFDAFIIGFLANNERNGIMDKSCIGIKNMNRTKDYSCFKKYDPILEVISTYYNENNIKITILKTKFLNKNIEVSSKELCINHYLLHSMDSLQALAIGYETSEALMQNI